MVYKIKFAPEEAEQFSMLLFTFNQASQPKTLADVRQAVKIEDALFEMAEEVTLSETTKAEDVKFAVRCSDGKIGKLKANGASLVLDDHEFPRVKGYLESFEKDQRAARAYLKLMEKFENAKGRELKEVIAEEAEERFALMARSAIAVDASNAIPEPIKSAAV